MQAYKYCHIMVRKYLYIYCVTTILNVLTLLKAIDVSARTLRAYDSFLSDDNSNTNYANSSSSSNNNNLPVTPNKLLSGGSVEEQDSLIGSIEDGSKDV